MSKNVTIYPNLSGDESKSNSVVKITLVKKIKADGNLCAKSADVFTKLQTSGLSEQIDEVVFADERKPSSEWLHLAIKHKAKSAPFFIVDREDGSTQIYTMYGRFLNEIFNHQITEKEQIDEIMAYSADLDFI